VYYMLKHKTAFDLEKFYNGPQKLDQGISKLWDEEVLNHER
jgi:hypothetical protein